MSKFFSNAVLFSISILSLSACVKDKKDEPTAGQQQVTQKTKKPSPLSLPHDPTQCPDLNGTYAREYEELGQKKRLTKVLRLEQTGSFLVFIDDEEKAKIDGFSHPDGTATNDYQAGCFGGALVIQKSSDNTPLLERRYSFESGELVYRVKSLDKKITTVNISESMWRYWQVSSLKASLNNIGETYWLGNLCKRVTDSGVEVLPLKDVVSGSIKNFDGAPACVADEINLGYSYEGDYLRQVKVAYSNLFHTHVASEKIFEFEVPLENQRLPKSFLGSFYQAKNAKGIIIYAHGGGCRLYPPTQQSALDLDWFPAFLYHQGYSILVLDYQRGIQNASSCTEATLSHISRLRGAVTSITDNFYLFEKNRIPIFIFGHSYGAGVVNSMATDDFKTFGISAYISYAGYWDIVEASKNESIGRQQNIFDYIASKDLRPTLKNPSNLSPLIEIHSVDDDHVPYSQLLAFEKWVLSGKTNNFQIIKMQNGMHFSEEDNFNQDLAKKIDQFLLKYK